MKKLILIVLMITLLIGGTGVCALAENTTAEPVQSSSVPSISLDEAVERFNSATMRVYVAGVEVIPNLAMIAMLCGCVLLLVSSAFGLEKIRNASIIGMGVIILAVIIAYMAPFFAGGAKGIGASF